MVVVGVLTTTVTLAFVVVVAAALIAFLALTASYLSRDGRGGGTAVTAAGTALLFLIGGGFVWFRYMAVGM